MDDIIFYLITFEEVKKTFKRFHYFNFNNNIFIFLLFIDKQ